MKRIIIILSAVVMTAIMISSCGCASYEEVTIGDQVWMTQNLNMDKFRNGDPIIHAKTDEEWEKAGENGQPAWCYYDNDHNWDDSRGKLYNWYAVNDPRGLAPEGWKIPSDEDWSHLIDFLGGESVAGNKMKSTGWAISLHAEPSSNPNESGFSGLPGGFRNFEGMFYDTGEYGAWWSSTEEYTDLALAFVMGYHGGTVGMDLHAKLNGLSVRCLRD